MEHLNVMIIQPTGDKYGHYGSFICNLAQELSLKGPNVIVYTNSLKPSNFLFKKPKFQIVEHNYSSLPFVKFEKQKRKEPLKFWYAYFRNSFIITSAALRYAKKNNVNVIYISDVEFLIASILLKVNRVNLPPVIMQVNASNFSFGDYSGNLIKKSYKFLQKQVFKIAIGAEIKAFSILNEWHEDRLRAQLNIKKSFPIEKIPDGSNSSSSHIPKLQARRKLNINFQGKIFLFIGILRRDKGLEVLRSAIERLARVNDQFMVIIAGHPFDYSIREVETLFSFSSEKSANILLKLEYISEEEYSSYFFASDCLVLPYNSFYKGSIGPLMRGACTYGLPVIVSDVSGMGQYASENNLGLIFRKDDADDLAEKMKLFLSLDPKKIKSFGESAKSTGAKNSWSSIASSYLEVFCKITS